MIETRNEMRHFITENGKFESRIATIYTKEGVFLAEELSDPMTAADTKDMAGWDDRSKEIVAVITDAQVMADFEAEKNEVVLDGVSYKHPDMIMGVGLEESRSFDMEITADGTIRVRCKERLHGDGKQISLKYLRYDLPPGADTTGRSIMSKAVAKKLHTPEVLVAYQEMIADNN